MSGTLFTTYEDALGNYHTDEPIARWENGEIYAVGDGIFGAATNGKLLAKYDNGKVYSIGSGTFNYGNKDNLIALCEDNQIYSVSKGIFGVSKNKVGSCSVGLVYGADGVMGKYTGDDEGAAATAAVVLFKLTSTISAHEEFDKDWFRKRDTNSGGSSGLGWVLGITIAMSLFAVVLFLFIWVGVGLAISTISFLIVWGIYKLIKYIQRKNSEIKESEGKKNKEMLIVLIISMIIAVGFTLIWDSGEAAGIALAVAEAIGFIVLIVLCKKGKLKKFSFGKKLFSKNKNVVTEDNIKKEKNEAVNEEENKVIKTEEKEMVEKSSRLKSTFEKKNTTSSSNNEGSYFTRAGDL